MDLSKWDVKRFSKINIHFKIISEMLLKISY